MAKIRKSGDTPEKVTFHRNGGKRTTIGGGKQSTAKMNKQQRRNYKKYRGQGVK
jgi:hypothetical protein